MKVILVFVAALLLGANAHAQLRKCVAPDGKVTYSDVLCDTSSKSSQTPATPQAGGYQSRADQGQPPTNHYAQELTRIISGYLAVDDFDHAVTLAVTQEHFQMIAAARKRRQNLELDKQALKIEEKKAAKARERIVCRTSGYSFGPVYSGTTVCR